VPKLKSFYDSEEEFTEIHHSLKQTSCPHCKRVGCLILHGYLKGYGEDFYDQDQIRGHRIYCSNRNTRDGCGRTFSLLPSSLLKGFTITALHLWLFLKKALVHASRIAAFKAADIPLCSDAAYYIFRSFSRNASRIRSFLLRRCPVPEPPMTDDPCRQTIEHLQAAFHDKSCPVSAFQNIFQTAFI